MDIKAAEYVCPKCGKVYDRYKGLHGHMMLNHNKEYARVGYTLSAYGISIDPLERVKREMAKNGVTVEEMIVEKEEIR